LLEVVGSLRKLLEVVRAFEREVACRRGLTTEREGERERERRVCYPEKHSCVTHASLTTSSGLITLPRDFDILCARADTFTYGFKKERHTEYGAKLATSALTWY
jgi:hypothetical protein